jgi:hypothetical protein
MIKQDEGVRTTRTIRAAAATLLVPCLMTLAIADAHLLYRCMGDQVARATCCCPETAKSTPAPAGAAVSEAGCCNIEIAPVAAAEARAQANGFEGDKTFPAPIAVVGHVAGPSASRVMARVEPRPQAPPKPPTLLLLKTSFLL